MITMINEGDAVNYIENLFKRKGIEIGAKGRKFIEDEVAQIKKPRVKAVIQTRWMIDDIDGKIMYQCIHCKTHYEHKYKYCPMCGAEMENHEF